MKLYVGNLSKEITDLQFTELVTPFGSLTSSAVARERGGDSKGFGFVEFGTADAAKAAIVGLNGKDVGGQMLKVSEARNQTPKDPLGGRY